MGWLTSDKPATLDAPQPSNDGGFIAPDRNQRAHCWEGRDAYFACLDRNNIVDSVKESDKAATACGKETQAFEKNCASSWVSRQLFAVLAMLNIRLLICFPGPIL